MTYANPYFRFHNTVPEDLPAPVSATACVKPKTDKLEFNSKDLAKVINAFSQGGYTFREEGPREIVMISKKDQQTTRICRPCTGMDTFIVEIKEGYLVMR